MNTVQKLRVKVIIFDFDGVIVESFDIKTKAFAILFESEGEIAVRKIIEYHTRNGGVSRYEKFKYIYENILKQPLTELKFQQLCKKFSDLVVDEVVSSSYVRGAKEFLEEHAELYRCFIATGTPQEEIEEIVRKRNIGHYFKGIYGAPIKKLDIVKKIINKEKITPSEAIYIGDALSDYEAAKINSVTFIARAGTKDSLFADISCLKIEDLTLLHKIIEKL
ncbi:MAG: HAD-IA family hydrolase [Thermodesulfobacteriota bacterium]